MLDSTVINLVRENIFSFVDGFFNPYFRWCWVYFVVFPFYALIPYYRNLSPSEFNFREFINYCFPKEIYFSQTTKVNFGLFFLMKIVFPTSFMYRFISVGGISLYVYELLNGIVSPFWARFDSSGMTIFLFSAFMFVSVDFSNFFVHYLSHKIKWAWEFHSVHHSGDSLTPLSLFRFHPIFNFLRFIENINIYCNHYKYDVLYKNYYWVNSKFTQYWNNIN